MRNLKKIYSKSIESANERWLKTPVRPEVKKSHPWKGKSVPKKIKKAPDPLTFSPE